jgi:two-component system cell cycle response regulator
VKSSAPHLIAEDNLESQLLLRRLLTRWGHEVIVTSDGLSAWQLLQRSDAPPMAILDWLMPGMDGIDICRKVRAESEASFIYLVLLTGKVKQQEIIEGIESGADDYLSKPFNQEELRVRLRAGQRIVELHQGLLEQATHDALTGLWNRKTVIEILQRELARGQRNGDLVAVVLVDIDHFKRINDTLGHPAGDVALRDVAHALRSSLRSSDTLGRYGGEEFLAVLPGCGGNDALAVAEKMRRVLEAEGAPRTELGPITVSIGVSTSKGTEFSNEALIKLADEALYRAKQRGRNRVESGNSCHQNVEQLKPEDRMSAILQMIGIREGLLDPSQCPQSNAVES